MNPEAIRVGPWLQKVTKPGLGWRQATDHGISSRRQTPSAPVLLRVQRSGLALKPEAADRLAHIDYDAIFGKKASWALVERSQSSGTPATCPGARAALRGCTWGEGLSAAAPLSGPRKQVGCWDVSTLGEGVCGRLTAFVT